MTTDKTPSDRTGAGAERDLAAQYWTAMARTADLVRKLTSLADRYDATIQDSDVRAADQHQRVVLMRTTADAGRQLIRSLAPPALSRGEQLARSPVEATRRTEQLDRDDSAPVRARSPTSQARTDALVVRLEECAVVRQAQGVLMARASMSAGEAFEALLLAAAGPRTLEGVADHVVRHGTLPVRQDVR